MGNVLDAFSNVLFDRNCKESKNYNAAQDKDDGYPDVATVKITPVGLEEVDVLLFFSTST